MRASSPSLLLVLALLGATAVAFVVAERLKLEPSPIRDTHVTKVFSPVCNCGTDGARIAFRLRRGETMEVAILDAGGRSVRTLVDRKFPRGPVELRWDGRDDAGRLVSPGRYRPRIRLQRDHRTIVMPNLIRVDTTRPGIALASVRPTVFSPDGDRRADRISVRYRVSEPAHALLFVDGRRRVRGRFQALNGELRWFGIVGGRPLPPGTYRLELRARDLAGNLSLLRPAGDVRIRYVEIERPVLGARAGRTFAVPVSTDAVTLKWSLRRWGGTRSFFGSGPVPLVARAPLTPGRYTLVVAAHGHRDSALVLVRKGR